MSMHPMSDPGETLSDSQDQTTVALRHITAEQLRNLGARQVVYLKVGVRNGYQAFGVFSEPTEPHLWWSLTSRQRWRWLSNTASILSASIEWKELPCQ